MSIHEKYMQRCIQIAKNGLGTTYPNPLVGSVIVYEGKIIGEGWHQKSGNPHAEVNAIQSVKNKELLSKSTIYINLEPCSHHGKTPPCADLIIRKQIKNVVIGIIDYNSKVHGKGVERLKYHGCNVIVGVLESECQYLNRRFFTFHQKKRPYIILKWAETKDGFIFPEENDKKLNKPIWISNSISLQLVHKWRTEEQSILVGTNTIVNDNPKLNARNYNGNSPIRVAIDRNLRTPKSHNFFDGTVETVIFTEKELINEGSKFSAYKIDFSKNVTNQILNVLYKRGIQSIIIEGGAYTLNSFIEFDLWDEARVFTSDNNFYKGIRAPNNKGESINKYCKTLEKRQIQNNILTIYSK